MQGRAGLSLSLLLLPHLGHHGCFGPAAGLAIIGLTAAGLASAGWCVRVTLSRTRQRWTARLTAASRVGGPGKYPVSLAARTSNLPASQSWVLSLPANGLQ